MPVGLADNVYKFGSPTHEFNLSCTACEGIMKREERETERRRITEIPPAGHAFHCGKGILNVVEKEKQAVRTMSLAKGVQDKAWVEAWIADMLREVAKESRTKLRYLQPDLMDSLTRTDGEKTKRI